MESIEDFNKRVCKRIPYADHSEYCKDKMDTYSGDHSDCDCDCHVTNRKQGE